MWSRHLDMLWIHRKGCLCQCPAESGECYHIHSKLIALLWSSFTARGFCVCEPNPCVNILQCMNTHTDKHTHTMGCNLEHVCITWFISSHLVPFICQLFLLWDWPLYNRKKRVWLLKCTCKWVIHWNKPLPSVPTEFPTQCTYCSNSSRSSSPSSPTTNTQDKLSVIYALCMAPKCIWTPSPHLMYGCLVNKIVHTSQAKHLTKASRVMLQIIKIWFNKDV